MEKRYDFQDFIEIIRKLRGKDGCPWDRKQTHESLRNCLIDECYEAVEAIDNGDKENLCEELGDVLLQVLMHSVIAQEGGEFTLDDVIDGISRKMVRRHPHVFGSEKAETAEQVLHNWDEIKKREKGENTVSEGLERVPRALPANIRAEQVQKKAAKAGMDFTGVEQVIDKIYEEMEELKEALQKGTETDIQEEFGDLMFSAVNLSRFLQLNAENSLTNATDKFINRFVDVERLAKEQGREVSELTVDELDEFWRQVK